jgi:hypothetical protein
VALFFLSNAVSQAASGSNQMCSALWQKKKAAASGPRNGIFQTLGMDGCCFFSDGVRTAPLEESCGVVTAAMIAAAARVASSR